MDQYYKYSLKDKHFYMYSSYFHSSSRGNYIKTKSGEGMNISNWRFKRQKCRFMILLTGGAKTQNIARIFITLKHH